MPKQQPLDALDLLDDPLGGPQENASSVGEPDLLDEFAQVAAERRQLNKRYDELKKTVLAFHDELDRDKLQRDGFYTLRVEQTGTSVDRDRLEDFLNSLRGMLGDRVKVPELDHFLNEYEKRYVRIYFEG